eukprot:gene28689-37677_t
MNQIVQTSDDKLVYECLNAENGLPFLNSLGGIKLRNLEVRNVGDRVLNDPIADLTAVQGEVVRHIDAVFAAKPTAARKAKSSIDVTNFFSKADSLKKLGEAASDTTAVECSARENSIVELSDPATKTDSKQVDDGEEAEWEEPEEVPVKKGKTAAKREHKLTKPPEPKSSRPRLDSKKEEQGGQLPVEQRDQDGEEQEQEQEQGQGQGQGRDISSSPPPAKQQRIKKRKEVLHGAMDDFMNEKDPDLVEQGAAAAPSEKQPKSKKRRLVEKMFADAKGYLVTEMVWEEFSDEEGDRDRDGDGEAEDKAEAAAEAAVPPASKPQPSLAATLPSSAAQAPKEKKPAAGAAKKAPKSNPTKGGTQKSMMSFFGAKP